MKCPKSVQHLSEFHDIRRTCLTNWLNSGLSEFDVMNLAGHSKFETTRKFYLAVNEDLVERARAVSAESSKLRFVAHLLRARRDSNPQPSDRQIISQESQGIVNHRVMKNTKSDLAENLADLFLQLPQLKMVLVKWHQLSDDTKRLIIKIIG